ncbi:MAG: hypothetical protein AB8B59_08745 [Maribacter sp.]
MKKVYLVLIALMISSVTFAQRGSTNTDHLGEMNGCVDARSSDPNGTYQKIMNSSAQTSEYKQAYQLGWARCRSSKDWVIVKGKLVNKGKTFDTKHKGKKISTFSGSPSFVKRLLGTKKK